MAGNRWDSLSVPIPVLTGRIRARAAARGLAQLREPHDLAELGRLVELAMADRTRVGGH
jgi:hypothetical protein